MLPFWLVGPLALVVMVIVAGHLLALRSAKGRVPASRYRIRTVNGSMMLAAVPLLACAFSVVSPSDRKLFVLIWLSCVGLLGIVVVLAIVDGLNNLRIGRREAAELIAEHRTALWGAGPGDGGSRGEADDGGGGRSRKRVADGSSESHGAGRDG